MSAPTKKVKLLALVAAVCGLLLVLYALIFPSGKRLPGGDAPALSAIGIWLLYTLGLWYVPRRHEELRPWSRFKILGNLIFIVGIAGYWYLGFGALGLAGACLAAFVAWQWARRSLRRAHEKPAADSHG